MSTTPKLTHKQALRKALRAVSKLYDSKLATEDEGGAHEWGDLATWEVKGQIDEALRRAFEREAGR